MKKRILSLFLAFVTLLGILPVTSLAAPTLEEAMAEVNIYGKYEPLEWLTMNGSVKTQRYTYYNYESPVTGQVKEIPAYCVDPRLRGVPVLVSDGTPIKYSASETMSDYKLVGIVSNGYPHQSLETLGLQTVEEGYYATKTAVWIHLLSGWSIDKLGINPNLSGADRAAAERVLQATKDIYWRGVAWNKQYTPKLTAAADRDTAYPVTINGESCYQQVFTITSETWAIERVRLSLAEGAPAGTKIMDKDNNEINSLVLDTQGDNGFSGTCKVVYPSSVVEGQTGSAQLKMSCVVDQYVVYYAKCLETDQYGNIQDYLLDTDPSVRVEGAAVSRFSSDPDTPTDPDEPDPGETCLKITKLETGTNTPLEGAVFEVLYPDGSPVGSFSTDRNGVITIPLSITGNYTVTEKVPPEFHLLPQHTTQNAVVLHGKTAELTFWNDPFGDLRVEKFSDTGEGLKGVTIQIKHIATGETKSGQTGPGGVIQFTGLKPGGWEVRETAGIEGWLADTETVQTVSVVSGQESTVTFTNKELPGLRIIKYDRTSLKVMSDIPFEVWRDGESLGQFQTDQQGEILLTNAQPGTYLVREVVSDDDHVTDTTPQQVELHAGDGIKELVFLNGKKPGIHLVKVDSANLSKTIPNAKFSIRAVDGTFGPQEYTTDINGEIDLSRLSPGAYEVVELECPGYVIDQAQRIIQLEADQNAEFVFTNSKYPDLLLKKTSSDGTPLAGVHFRLAKIEDGSRYLDRTTNARGEVLWEGLEPGVYSLRETATVADHILDLREYHVELFPGKVSTITIENQKRPNLIVYKKDADTGDPIPNTVFLVKAADGHSVDEIKTDSAGKAVLSNLLPGVYEVSEKSVPAPWLMDAPSQLVTLYPNRDHTVYFQNHKKPTLTVNKVDSITGGPIKGAKFEVWYGSNNTTTGELNSLGTFFSDENGQFTLDLLRDGWYRVEELEPASGYAIKEPVVQEFYIKGGESKTICFQNTPLSALVVWKYDSVTSAPVEGAIFQVKYMSGTSGSGGTVIGTYKTGPGGSFTVNRLEAGAYLVEELASDGGHVMDTAPQTAYISGKEQDVVQLYFGNSPKGAVLIKKISAGDHSPLSDVEFFITDSKGTLLGDANGKFVTDSAGTILISNLNPGTTVVARETRAKPGYLLDDVPQTVTIQAGRTATLEFRNQPKGSVTLYKFSSSDRRTPLEGVGFKITYADGRVVDNIGGKLSSNGIYYTDSEGQINISQVTGTLIFTEISSIPGYLIDENRKSQTIVVNPDDHQSVYFYNVPENTLIIEKYLETEAGNEPLKGVTFLVTDSAGSVIGSSNGEFITGEDGRIVIDGVAPGTTVIAREIKVPDGVVLDSTPKTIKIGDKGANTLRFVDQKTGHLVVRKLDKQTKEPLSGVEFELTYADGSFVDDAYGHLSSKGRFKTNDAGEIRVPVVGTVVVKELTPCPGYVMDESTRVQTVKVNPADTQTIVVYNEPLCSLTLKKLDAVTGKPVPNTEFTLKDGDGNVLGRYTTGADGTVTVTGLIPNSTVVVVESKVPSNYVLDPTPRTIIVRNGSNSLSTGTAGGGNGNTGTGSGNGNNVTVENVPKVTLTIEKYLATESGEQPLKGVTFLVTDQTGAVIGGSNGEFTSDENGRVVIPNLEPGTTVTAKEIRVPEGVVLDSSPKSILIKAGEQGQTLRVVNKSTGYLVVKKLDKISGKPLAGVEFKLTYASGEYVDDAYGHLSSLGLYTTDQNGEIRVPVVGTVVVEETKCLPGYTIDPGTQRQVVTVNPADTQTVKVYNTPIGGVEIIKVNEADKTQRIPNTTFEIRKMDGGLVKTVTTDKQGRVHVSLDAGNFYAVEIEAAEGFKIDSTPHYFTVQDGKTTTLTVTNAPFSGIILHKIDSVTGLGIYNVKFLVYDQNKNPIGEYSTDDQGYIYLDDLTVQGKGRLYIRELEAAPGYELDKEYKTVYVQPGKTIEIEWENTPITGQFQIYKYAAEYNEVTGTPAGAPLQGAVYEISEARSGKVVDYITTDARGVAASKPLPLGRYKIVETTAPAYWQLSGKTFDETLEYSGQIIKISDYDKPSNLGVSITKRGNAEVMAGSQMRYDFTVANTSNVPLENYYWHDRIPTDAARATVFTTGTYSARLNYRVLYKTNYSGAYQVLASNLITSSNYSFSLNAIPMQAGEYVTDVYCDFGKVPVGFQSVANPTLTVQVLGTVANGYQIINRADVGGKYQGTWQTAQDAWVTIVRKLTPNPTLPKTGY